MPRIRIEFSKGDQVRFISHLDLMKAFERAIRRAGIPIALSEGFNPHPKMNFASAVAVGVTSDAEYLDMDLRYAVDADETVKHLAQALPQGLEAKRGRIIPDNTPAMMAEINRAVYRVVASCESSIEDERLQTAITDFIRKPEIIISKMTKKGPKPKDIRPGIIKFAGNIRGNAIEFSVTTLTGSEGNVRPEEAVCAFAAGCGLPMDCESMYIRRTGLFIARNGQMLNPMDAAPNDSLNPAVRHAIKYLV